jgi:hypothetical protein
MHADGSGAILPTPTERVGIAPAYSLTMTKASARNAHPTDPHNAPIT